MVFLYFFEIYTKEYSEFLQFIWISGSVVKQVPELNFWGKIRYKVFVSLITLKAHRYFPINFRYAPIYILYFIFILKYWSVCSFINTKSISKLSVKFSRNKTRIPINTQCSCIYFCRCIFLYYSVIILADLKNISKLFFICKIRNCLI